VDETEDVTSIYIRNQLHGLHMTDAHVEELTERESHLPPPLLSSLDYEGPK
jgi:hypothetical protein